MEEIKPEMMRAVEEEEKNNSDSDYYNINQLFSTVNFMLTLKKGKIWQLKLKWNHLYSECNEWQQSANHATSVKFPKYLYGQAKL